MKLASNVLTVITWGKSHRVLLLLSFLLVAAVALVSWYYISVNATQRVPRVTPELIKQLPSSASIPNLSDTSANGVTIQSIIQSENTAPLKTRVYINGQQVPTPQTGTVHKVIQDNNGTTTVDISVDANSSGDTSTSSFTNIELNSTTELNSSSESSQ